MTDHALLVLYREENVKCFIVNEKWFSMQAFLNPYFKDFLITKVIYIICTEVQIIQKCIK